MKKKASTIIKRVKKLAKQYPNAVYNDSDAYSYTIGKVTNGPETPGCIIGQACKGYLTIPYDCDEHTIESLLEGELSDKVLSTQKEINWLSHVQWCQDREMTWEESIISADENITDEL